MAWDLSAKMNDQSEVSVLYNSNLASDGIILIYLHIQNNKAYKVKLKLLRVSIIMLVLQPKFIFNAYHFCGNYVQSTKPAHFRRKS